MKKNKIIKTASLLVAMSLVITVFTMPFRAYAEFFEEGIELDIDTSTINLADAWGQIKNAAIIHLVAQKMQKCISQGQVILNADDTGGIMGGTVWPPHTSWLDGKGVLDKGNVFKAGALLSGDVNQKIGTGPWLSSIYGSNSGEMKCNAMTSKGSFFDMFVYIYKNSC